MMAAYSQDLRDRVLWGLARGEGPTSIARRLEVSVRWVYHVKARYEQTGERVPAQLGGYRRSCVADQEATIRAWLKEQADLTLVELCDRLTGVGLTIKPTALWHQLNKWGLRFKKNAARQRAGTRGRRHGTHRVESPAGRA